ncbi:MAG: HTH domain-containing protein, partial [Prevotellaceae bacterium]|nr:HTH domain-containing protein [Prevotellaceae bacterium]
NDYSQGNTPIFEIFSNRIEITTYGNLLQWISEEDFFAGVSKPRNREIMRVLNDLDFVENIGSGIPFLVKTYGKDIFYFSNSISRISFFFEQGEKVEIPRKNRVKNREKSSVESSVENDIQCSENKVVSNVYSSVKNRVESSEKSREKILMVIEANSDITIPELAYYLHLSTRAIEKTLKSLREENKICRVGAKKGGHWEVVN